MTNLNDRLDTQYFNQYRDRMAGNKDHLIRQTIDSERDAHDLTILRNYYLNDSFRWYFIEYAQLANYRFMIALLKLVWIYFELLVHCNEDRRRQQSMCYRLH